MKLTDMFVSCACNVGLLSTKVFVTIQLVQTHPNQIQFLVFILVNQVES